MLPLNTIISLPARSSCRIRTYTHRNCRPAPWQIELRANCVKSQVGAHRERTPFGHSFMRREGIEPSTSSLSTKCSAVELPAQRDVRTNYGMTQIHLPISCMRELWLHDGCLSQSRCKAQREREQSQAIQAISRRNSAKNRGFGRREELPADKAGSYMRKRESLLSASTLSIRCGYRSKLWNTADFIRVSYRPIRSRA